MALDEQEKCNNVRQSSQNRKFATETVTNNYNHYNEDVNLYKSNEMIASFLKP